MPADSIYEGIEHVIHISSNIGKNCEHCGLFLIRDELAEHINHYIEQHGYKLLHVGAETTNDLDGKPLHLSVAVLGQKQPMI